MTKSREPDEPEAESHPGANELLYLRELAGVSRPEHAAILGHKSDSLLRKCERGIRLFGRDYFVALVTPIGHGPEAVDVMLALHPVLKHLPPPEPPSPVSLRRDHLASIDRACLAAAAGLLDCLRPLMIREEKRREIAAARQAAEAAWADLKDKSWKERRHLVETWPAYRTWAVAARVCQASIKAAANRADGALDLAKFAIFIADRVEETYRARTQGFCWGHYGNALRVGEDFDGADRAFVRAWERWHAGADTDPELLPKWWMYSLEASLRRAQHRFPEALERLGRARACCGGDKLAACRILLGKSNVYHQMGDAEGALAALDEAAPLVEELKDPELRFALRFNRADLLVRLERHGEAAHLVPEVREMAAEQGNELSLTRVDWLEAKVLGGLGLKEEAMDRLEKVRDKFTAGGHPYDAALATLDLAALKLEAGHRSEVEWLALGLKWIFSSKKIDREALVALRLFYDAALQGTATVELTRQVIAEIEKVRRSAPPARG
jgi:tetratricopeptide (TPR) repeat protein